MNLSERIQRRRAGRREDRLVVDWDALNPAVHLHNPIGRTAHLEALLDVLDPIFDHQLPPSVYFWGPKGSGKSALVTALFRALATELSNRGSTYTSTRGRSALSNIRFVYVDGREANSRFKLYHRMLDELLIESVPRRGIGTGDLIERLQTEMTNCAGVLLAVDHVSIPGGVDLGKVQEYLDPFTDVSLFGVGRDPPEELALPLPEAQLYLPAYTYELIDVLTVRASRGLTRSLDPDAVRQISEWSDGNAHDALTALYVATIIADEAGDRYLHSDHVAAALEEIPKAGSTMAEILSLSPSELTVVEALLADPELDGLRIDTLAQRIAVRSELSENTVTRMLYELAQEGILDRTEVRVGTHIVGRRPSIVHPNFSTRAFNHALSR